MGRSQTVVIASCTETFELFIPALGPKTISASLLLNFGAIYPYQTRSFLDVYGLGVSGFITATREVEVRGAIHELYEWDPLGSNLSNDFLNHIPFNIFTHPDSVELWEKWTFPNGVVENVVKARSGSSWQPQFDMRGRQIVLRAGLTSNSSALETMAATAFVYAGSPVEFEVYNLVDANTCEVDSDGETLTAKALFSGSAHQSRLEYTMSGPLQVRAKVRVVTPDLQEFDDLRYRLIFGKHTVIDGGASDAAKNVLVEDFVVETTGQHNQVYAFPALTNARAASAGPSSGHWTREVQSLLPRIWCFPLGGDAYTEEGPALTENAWEWATSAIAAAETRHIRTYPRYHAGAGVRGFPWRRLWLERELSLPARTWTADGDGSVDGQELTAGSGGCEFEWELSDNYDDAVSIVPYRWARLRLTAESSGSATFELYQSDTGSGRKRWTVSVREGTHEYWLDLCDPDQVEGSAASGLGLIDATEAYDLGLGTIFTGRYSGICRLFKVVAEFSSNVVTVEEFSIEVRYRAEILWGLQSAMGHLDYRDAFRKLGVVDIGRFPYDDSFGAHQVEAENILDQGWPPGWQPQAGFDTVWPYVINQDGSLRNAYRSFVPGEGLDFLGERYIVGPTEGMISVYDGIGQTQMIGGDPFVAEFIVVVGGVAFATAVPPAPAPMQVDMPDPAGDPHTGGAWTYETGPEGWGSKSVHKLWPFAVGSSEEVEHYNPDHSPLVKDEQRFDDVLTSATDTTQNQLIHLFVASTAESVEHVHSCADEDGFSYVVYKIEERIECWRYGRGESVRFLVSDDPAHQHPKVMIGPGQDLVVVFDDDVSSFAVISLSGGQFWSEAVEISAGTNPSPCSDVRDAFSYVAVFDDPMWKCYRKGPGGSWAYVADITDEIPEGSVGLHVETDKEWRLAFIGSNGSLPRRWVSSSQGEFWQEE